MINSFRLTNKEIEAEYAKRFAKFDFDTICLALEKCKVNLKEALYCNNNKDIKRYSMIRKLLNKRLMDIYKEYQANKLNGKEV